MSHTGAASLPLTETNFLNEDDPFDDDFGEGGFQIF